jgi:hypothetical protein
MNERSLADLVALLREHRSGVEERLADHVGLLRGEKQRGDKLMNRLEKMRDRLCDLLDIAKKAHKKCLVRDCVGCYAIKQANRTLAEFRWE